MDHNSKPWIFTSFDSSTIFLASVFMPGKRSSFVGWEISLWICVDCGCWRTDVTMMRLKLGPVFLHPIFVQSITTLLVWLNGWALSYSFWEDSGFYSLLIISENRNGRLSRFFLFVRSVSSLIQRKQGNTYVEIGGFLLIINLCKKNR